MDNRWCRAEDYCRRVENGGCIPRDRTSSSLAIRRSNAGYKSPVLRSLMCTTLTLLDDVLESVELWAETLVPLGGGSAGVVKPPKVDLSVDPEVYVTPTACLEYRDV